MFILILCLNSPILYIKFTWLNEILIIFKSNVFYVISNKL